MKLNYAVILMGVVFLLGVLGMWLVLEQKHTLRQQRVSCESHHSRVFIVDRNNKGHCLLKTSE
jgi:hypothetical protein